jgi:hypothetical protein
MYQIGDKAIYYDGTQLTFKKVICSNKGVFYFFEELPYSLSEDEFSDVALPLVKSKKKILARQGMIR